MQNKNIAFFSFFLDFFIVLLYCKETDQMFHQKCSRGAANAAEIIPVEPDPVNTGVGNYESVMSSALTATQFP